MENKSFGRQVLFVIALCAGCNEADSTEKVIHFPVNHQQTYHWNRQLKSEGLLINSKRHGIWKLYDPDGKIMAKITYHLDSVTKITGYGNPVAGHVDSIMSMYAEFGKKDLPVVYAGQVKMYLFDSVVLYCDSLFRPENNYDSIIVPGEFKIISANGNIYGKELYSANEMKDFQIRNISVASFPAR